VAFVIVGGVLAIAGSAIPGVPSTSGVDMGQLLGLFGGGILAAVLGVVDDALDLRARWQFLGQVVVALVAVVAGITVNSVGDAVDPGHGEDHRCAPRARRPDRRLVLGHRPTAHERSIAVQSGSGPYPPSIARRGTFASLHRLAHLPDVRDAGADVARRPRQ